MKPLDSNDSAERAPESEGAENLGVAPSGFARSDDAVVTPRSQSDIVAAFQNRGDPATSPTRVSRVVPLGTAAEESVNDAAEPSDSSSMRPSDVVPRDATADENRAAARVADLAMTRQGPSFGADEDDEATTVDAAAGLSFEEREALGLRVHSSMEETQLQGTPSPAPVQAVDEAEAARDRRNLFKQTMLLGLPMRETPPPAAAASAEPAVMASAVRVVGPPTQPPPRRSRRVGPIATSPQAEPDHPDHEAFALMNAIAAPAGAKKVVPDAAPAPATSARAAAPAMESSPAASTPGETTPPAVSGLAATESVGPVARRSVAPPAPIPSLSVSSSRRSLPGVILPPAPAARDYELDSSPLHSTTSPPLRATIDSPSPLVRTRPPQPRHTVEPPVDDLRVSDPFAGFVAPPPSLLQRWLVVMVVALAVVGLCSLAAIAFGFLGKTGW